MRLIELRLQNFRQHVDTTIQFRPGLTGIVGPNGAGKSTLLEAVAWAIYGADAARGTNETIRFARAAPRSRVEVELRFALADREYRVVRSLSNAEVFLDGSAAPVATSVGGVSRYLRPLLGMTRQEFFNTYFTGQKELHFLAGLGRADRGRFLSTVLGYERLRAAQELAKQRKKELRQEIDLLRSGLPDAREVRAERERADEAVVVAKAALADAEKGRKEATKRLETITPRWATAQTTRDQFRELSNQVESAARDRAAAAREIASMVAELERIAKAEGELTQLREQIEPLPALVAECERHSQLARTHERRKALTEQIAVLEKELEQSRDRLAGLEKAPALLIQFTAEVEALTAETARIVTALEAKKTDWVRDKQDAATKLQLDKTDELKAQIEQLREAGPAGKCPTCSRPLGDDFTRLLGELEDQWSNSVQDRKWWQSRTDQLKAKPDEIVALEAELAAVQQQAADKTRKHTRCEMAIQELGTVRQERTAREEWREKSRAELAAIPSDYDVVRHKAAESELKALRLVETRAAQLEEVVKRKDDWTAQIADARTRDAEAAARAAAATRERDGLKFSEAAFEELRRDHDTAAELRRLAELRAAEARGVLSRTTVAAEAAAKAQETYEEKVREIEVRDADHRHHGELDAAFSQLRSDLNGQVRPELSEIASLFLAQLTDGRYTSLEIDEDYDICVLDEGEEKPVISGGEEDVANLVLRLSLSQMIAERAGYPLSLLILDEVFGSLDVARRDNVVQLLRRLEDRFEQVILITHIDGLRESLDQVLYVSYDERTGSSVVREEFLSGTAHVLPDYRTAIANHSSTIAAWRAASA